MRFEKWHGAGNAYLVMEAGGPTERMPAALVARICHPDLGAGSDGILEILPSSVAHARVRIYNPDGGLAEFSGNGSRIAVGYLARRDGLRELSIETEKGVVAGIVEEGSVTVDAGEAVFDGSDHRPDDGDPPAPAYTFVNLGNPHCVIRADDVDELDLAAVGAPIERHPWFPNRVNVEFYRPLGEHDIRMRVWERGAGETLSSGSGSSAAAVAAVTAGDARSPVTVHADGGLLVVEISADMRVRLTGPVEPVLSGEFDPAFTEHS
ncbi:MAG: diaminopimelate epimerase [Gaiellales bacterium]